MGTSSNGNPAKGGGSSISGDIATGIGTVTVFVRTHDVAEKTASSASVTSLNSAQRFRPVRLDSLQRLAPEPISLCTMHINDLLGPFVLVLGVVKPCVEDCRVSLCGGLRLLGVLGLLLSSTGPPLVERCDQEPEERDGWADQTLQPCHSDTGSAAWAWQRGRSRSATGQAVG
jgi:hypothetical protein